MITADERSELIAAACQRYREGEITTAQFRSELARCGYNAADIRAEEDKHRQEHINKQMMLLDPSQVEIAPDTNIYRRHVSTGAVIRVTNLGVRSVMGEVVRGGGHNKKGETVIWGVVDTMEVRL